MQPLLGSLVCLSHLICILHQQPLESTETKVCGSTHLELSDGVLSLSLSFQGESLWELAV